MGFKFALFALVVFLVVAFVLPLLAFTPVLKSLKKQGLSRYGALASRHNLAFEARWIQAANPDEPAEGALGSPDVSSLADLAAGYALVEQMRSVPWPASVIPLILAALLPLMVVAATQAPFGRSSANSRAWCRDREHRVTFGPRERPGLHFHAGRGSAMTNQLTPTDRE